MLQMMAIGHTRKHGPCMTPLASKGSPKTSDTKSFTQKWNGYTNSRIDFNWKI